MGREIELAALHDGVSLRSHLRSMWRQEGFDPDKMPEQLQPVDCPDDLLYLWEYFLDMSQRRPSGFGASAISHEGVEAWARRRRLRLLPFEHRALDAIEGVYLRIQQEKARQK